MAPGPAGPRPAKLQKPEEEARKEVRGTQPNPTRTGPHRVPQGPPPRIAVLTCTRVTPPWSERVVPKRVAGGEEGLVVMEPAQLPVAGPRVAGGLAQPRRTGGEEDLLGGRWNPRAVVGGLRGEDGQHCGFGGPGEVTTALGPGWVTRALAVEHTPKVKGNDPMRVPTIEEPEGARWSKREVEAEQDGLVEDVREEALLVDQRPQDGLAEERSVDEPPAEAGASVDSDDSAEERGTVSTGLVVGAGEVTTGTGSALIGHSGGEEGEDEGEREEGVAEEVAVVRLVHQEEKEDEAEEVHPGKRKLRRGCGTPSATWSAAGTPASYRTLREKRPLTSGRSSDGREGGVVHMDCLRPYFQSGCEEEGRKPFGKGRG